MTKNNPLVSIIIPTHNRVELLKRALHSALSQTYQPIEIIVIDDGSTDGTETFLSDLSITYPEINYLKHSTPKGAPQARNSGIRKAKGEFLTFLDDDDELLPDNISFCMQNYNDDYAYVITGRTIINHQNKITVLPKGIIKYSDMLYKLFVGNQFLTRKERVIKLGKFDETLTSSQDYDMLLRLNEKYGDAIGVRKPLLIIHTEHELPRITSSSNKIRGAMAFYRKHKSEMNRSQRKYQLFYILKLKRKKICLIQFISYVPIIHYWQEIKYYLLINYPILSRSSSS